MLHHRCKAAAPSVQGCWTIGIRVLDHQYKGAGPSVPGCCTFLVPLFEYLYIDLIKKNSVNP